jgi:hypothetical protein
MEGAPYQIIQLKIRAELSLNGVPEESIKDKQT